MLSIDRFLSSKRDFRFFSSILLICWPLKPLINLFFKERNILSKKTLLLTICSVKWEKTWKFHFYKLLFDAPSRFCQGMRQMKQDAEKSSTFRFGLFVKSLKSRKKVHFTNKTSNYNFNLSKKKIVNFSRIYNFNYTEKNKIVK